MLKDRWIFLIENDIFYYPDFLNYVCSQIIGAYNIEIICIFVNNKENKRLKYLIKSCVLFNFEEIKGATSFIFRKIFSKNLHDTAKTFNLEFHYAERESVDSILGNLINQNDRCVNIFSASPFIVHEEFINSCDYAINMHFSPLPKFKGIMPLFWGLLENDVEWAVSIHKLAFPIDSGELLFSFPTRLDPKLSLVENYEIMFRASAVAVVSCLQDLIPPDRALNHKSLSKASYHSFPDNQAWKRFKKAGLSVF